MSDHINQSVDWNITKWNEIHDWPERGEEWSGAYGSSTYQWQVTILPRILAFIPARNILEIAPGYGRWTRFLLNNCSRYTGVDISDKAIQDCINRFCFNKNARFVKNDGKSLLEINDNSIDFIFSMDSLVHAEIDAIKPYIEEWSRVLSSNGYGFIHHSNMGEHQSSTSNEHDRARSVSAEIFKDLCDKNGLRCIVQEKINWGQTETNDCFSVFTSEQSAPTLATKTIVNDKFDMESSRVRQLFSTYYEDL